MLSPFRIANRPVGALGFLLGRAERRLRVLARALSTGRSGEIAAALSTLPRAPEATPEPRAGAALMLPAVAWDYRWQRPQQLAVALAGAGRPVVYADPFARGHVGPGSFARSRGPTLLWVVVRLPGRPDPYRSVPAESDAARLSDELLASLAAPPAWIHAQLPFWAPVAAALAARTGAPIVYDRLDLQAGFESVPAAVLDAEARLLADADLVVSTSGALAEASRRLAKRVELLRNGVDLETFPLAPRPPARPRPQVGFVGALAAWVDAEAVELAARARPGIDFALAGRVEDPACRRLARLANVRLPGEIPYRAVPGFLAGLDAALLPFRDLPLTRAVDPVKLYEALACGLPLAARRLPETGRWAAEIELYDAPEELPAAIDRALAAGGAVARATRRAAVGGESWVERAAALERLVASLLRSPPRIVP